MSTLDKQAVDMWLVCDGPIEDQLVLNQFNDDRHWVWIDYEEEDEVLAKMGL